MFRAALRLFVRLAFLVLALMQGLGIFVYVVLFLIMPAPHVQILMGRAQGQELARLLRSAQQPISLVARLIGLFLTIVSGVIGLVSFVANVLGILDSTGFTLKDLFMPP